MAVIKKILPLAAVFVGVLFVRRDLGVDIWFMLNTGRYILAQGFPMVEPFTIHENLSFMVQQWLTCIIFWRVYELFGYAGLVWLARIMGAVVAYLYYRLCLRVSAGNKPLSVMLASLVGMLVCLIFVYPRPIIFSAAIFLAEVLILEAGQRRPRVLWGLPVLSWLLVNLHAAMWSVLFVLMLPYIVASFRLRALEDYVFTGISLPKRTLFFAAACCVAAAFVNPYGADAILYGARSYGVGEVGKLVGEMHPLTVETPLFIVPAIFFLFLLPAYGRFRAPLQYVLLTVGTFYMALTAIRNELLFLLFGTLGAAFLLREKNFLPADGSATSSAGKKIRRLVLAATAVLFVLAGINNSGGEKKVTVRGEEYYYGEVYKPAADFLLADADAADIRLFSEYNSGAYFEFRGIKCYIDSRAEVFFAANNGVKDIFSEYAAIFWGDLPMNKFLQRYDFTHVFVTTDNLILYNAMQKERGWVKVFEFSIADGKNPWVGRVYKRTLR